MKSPPSRSLDGHTLERLKLPSNSVQVQSREAIASRDHGRFSREKSEVQSREAIASRDHGRFSREKSEVQSREAIASRDHGRFSREKSDAGVATPAWGDCTRCACSRSLSRMPGWSPRHWEIVRDLHAGDRSSECRGGHPGMGRSYEIYMQIVHACSACMP